VLGDVGIGQFTSLSHYARTFDCRECASRHSSSAHYKCLKTAIRFDRFPLFFFSIFRLCVHESFFGYLSSFIFVKLEKEKHFIIIFIRLTAVDSERGMLRNDFFRSV
jgi:hypothetical protein